MKNKHTHISFIALFFIIPLFLSSCYLLEPPANTTANVDPVAATVIKLQLDGCSWMLTTEGERNLEPAGIPAEFQQKNLRVLGKIYST